MVPKQILINQSIESFCPRRLVSETEFSIPDRSKLRCLTRTVFPAYHQ